VASDEKGVDPATEATKIKHGDVLTVVVFPDPVLREKCREVSAFDEKLKKLVGDMAETMYANEGVGLAAPQVGLPIRVAVIDTAPAEERGRAPVVLVNPVIVEREGTLEWKEGCLSLPGVEVETNRSARVTVRARDAAGSEISVTGEGLAAVAMQHEIDHLDGVLLFDHLSPLRKRLAIRDYSRGQRAEKLEEPEQDDE